MKITLNTIVKKYTSYIIKIYKQNYYEIYKLKFINVYRSYQLTNLHEKAMFSTDFYLFFPLIY